MSADIIFDGTFPHGTPQGYTDGCRSGHCPAPMACRDVHTRYQGDWAFRKALDAGATPAEFFEQVRAASEEARGRAKIREAARRRHNEARKKARAATPKGVKRSADGVPRTPNQLLVHRLHHDGLTDLQIAERTGKTRVQVKAIRSYLGLPANHLPTVDERLKALHAEGLNDVQIGIALDKNPKYIGHRRRYFGLAPNTPQTLATAGVPSS